MADKAETDWIEWNGGEEPPCAFEDILAIRHRDGDVSAQRNFWKGAFGCLDWTHAGDGGDIIAYRVVSS